MSYITPYQYYYNGGNLPESINHGSYQYLSMNDIVNNFALMFIGEDKILDNVPSHEVRFSAKQVVKQLNFDAFRSVKVLEADIGDTLTLVMPHDYVDYVRISLEKSGVLYPLTENTKPFVANSYLKDNSNELLFDQNQEVIYGSSELELNRKNDRQLSVGGCYSIGPKFGNDPSKMNSNPRFRIDRQRGVIDFDNEMMDEMVVIEYISDGMEDGDDDQIVIHKFFENYVYKQMQFSIARSKRNIAETIRQQLSKEAHAEYRNAKIRIMDLKPERMLMALRQQEKTIK